MHETTETPASEQQEINDLNGLHDESIQMDPGLITEVNIEIDIFDINIF